MKIRTISVGLFTLVLFSACIQNEPLNVEAAIDGCSGINVETVQIDSEHKIVQVYVKNGTDFSAQELRFELPSGAVLTADEPKTTDKPPVYDFSEKQERTFTVTSESGTVKVKYRVRLEEMQLNLHYAFEQLKQKDPFHIIYLTDGNDGAVWGSGNDGYKLTQQGKTPIDYPTAQAEEGWRGKCVRLVTCSTGFLGSLVGMKIAAGNLFLGTFNMKNAMSKPLEATEFGYTIRVNPIKLTGWYKYYSGGEVPETKLPDRGDIYGVLFKTDNDADVLYGNLFDDPVQRTKIVSVARMDRMDEVSKWTYFEIPFILQPGMTINHADLLAGKYKLALVFTSSRDGGNFKGAVGSELWIDEVSVIYE